MKLSMWMLADWLEKYHPVVKIASGEPVLRGARILSANMKTGSQNVYLAPASEYINGASDQIICVHGHDMIRLHTQDMDEVLNDIFDAFDYYNNWHDGLKNDIQNGCSLQHLIDASGAVLEEPVAVFDAGHMLIAHTQNYGPKDVDLEWEVLLETGHNSFDILDKMKKHLHDPRFEHEVEELDLPYFNMRSLQRLLFCDKTIMGRIILLEFIKKLTPRSKQLLDILAGLLERWMDEADEQQKLREKCKIFKDILDGKKVQKEELEHRLSIVGWKPTHEKRLFQIEIPSLYRDMLYPMLSKLERKFPDCYVFLYHENIYILANIFFTPFDQLCRRAEDVLSQNTFRCAVSYSFQDVFLLRTPFEQCSFTLQAVSGQKNGLYFCKDHALDYIKNIFHTQVNPAFVHPALLTLKKYDDTTQNDLYRTLYIYLTHNCNLTHTARLLNLHRNSLLYRLNKILTLTGLDLNDERLREYLYLSYVILDGSDPKDHTKK